MCVSRGRERALSALTMSRLPLDWASFSGDWPVVSCSSASQPHLTRNLATLMRPLCIHHRRKRERVIFTAGNSVTITTYSERINIIGLRIICSSLYSSNCRRHSELSAHDITISHAQHIADPPLTKAVRHRWFYHCLRKGAQPAHRLRTQATPAHACTVNTHSP
jgi:hypothetical protein